MSEQAKNSKIEATELNLHLRVLNLHYARKTKSILHAVTFLLQAEFISATHSVLKPILDDFKQCLKEDKLRYQEYFYGMLLFALISEVEIYFVDIVKALIQKYPKKVEGAQFQFSTILDLSLDVLISSVTEEYLNRIMRKKPSEYLSEFAMVLEIDEESFKEHWPAFVEAKARRDLGAHNNWLINETYTRKVAEMGLPAPVSGDNLIIPDFQYLKSTIKVCDTLVESIHAQLMVKYP